MSNKKDFDESMAKLRSMADKLDALAGDPDTLVGALNLFENEWKRSLLIAKKMEMEADLRKDADWVAREDQRQADWRAADERNLAGAEKFRVDALELQRAHNQDMQNILREGLAAIVAEVRGAK